MDYLMVRNRFHLSARVQAPCAAHGPGHPAAVAANRIRRPGRPLRAAVIRAVVHGLAGRQGKPGGIA
jgi:hypothetical protein